MYIYILAKIKTSINTSLRLLAKINAGLDRALNYGYYQTLLLVEVHHIIGEYTHKVCNQQGSASFPHDWIEHELYTCLREVLVTWSENKYN